MTEWRRNSLYTAKRNLNYVFQSPRTRRLVMADVDEMASILRA